MREGILSHINRKFRSETQVLRVIRMLVLILVSQTKKLPYSLDRVVLHDQPVLGRDRDAVLGDEATRDGQDEGGARAPQLFVDVEQLHQLGDAKLLPRDHPAHRSPPPQTGKTLSSVIATVEFFLFGHSATHNNNS